MMKRLLVGAIMSLGIMTHAHAGIIFQSGSISPTNTDFTDQSISFAQFDDFDGMRILESIELTLFGELFSVAQVENFSNNSASIIDILVSGSLMLDSVAGNMLISTPASIDRTFSATQFDGIADFGGTSGVTFDELYVNSSNNTELTDPSVLAMFIGEGFVETLLSAFVDTSASGGGNILAGFTTNAAGNVELVYNYRVVNQVSEPVGVMLMGGGLLAMAAVRRKKQNVKALSK